MDPVLITIVSALVAGATAAAKDVATSAVKDAYSALKRLIVDRYHAAGPAIDLVEHDPDSQAKRAVLTEDLAKSGATGDQQLKAAAQMLLGKLEELHSDSRAAAMFDFGTLRAAKNFELKDIQLIGTLFRARDATFEGDFKAEGIRQQPFGGATKKH